MMSDSSIFYKYIVVNGETKDHGEPTQVRKLVTIISNVCRRSSVYYSQRRRRSRSLEKHYGSVGS